LYLVDSQPFTNSNPLYIKLFIGQSAFIG
jgi:hypothetical protein